MVPGWYAKLEDIWLNNCHALVASCKDMKTVANEKTLKRFLNHLFWFVVTFTLLIGFQVTLTGFLTGYSPNNFSFLLWDQFHFFTRYLIEEPVKTLSFIFIDKPLFKIEALQENQSLVTWGLHYYGITLLVHTLIAFLASRAINTYTFSKSALKSFPVVGAILLYFSSLFLYLSSCCTAGANWIIHTMVLAVFFNPYMASENLIELYKEIHGGFIYIQILMVVSGLYLVFINLKSETKREY